MAKPFSMYNDILSSHSSKAKAKLLKQNAERSLLVAFITPDLLSMAEKHELSHARPARASLVDSTGKVIKPARNARPAGPKDGCWKCDLCKSVTVNATQLNPK